MSRETIELALDFAVIFATVLVAGLLFAVVGAHASSSATRARASSYGPGLYGNRLACGGRLWPATRAVASRSLACGTRLAICHRGRCTVARVRDRGPFVAGRELDLSEAVVRRLGASSAAEWGVRTVRYRRAGR